MYVLPSDTSMEGMDYPHTKSGCHGSIHRPAPFLQDVRAHLGALRDLTGHRAMRGDLKHREYAIAKGAKMKVKVSV